MALPVAACLPLPPSRLPHTTAGAAWRVLLEHTPQLVCWPQLPRRSEQEQAWGWAATGLPGLVSGAPLVDRARFESGLDDLYLAYLLGRIEYAALEPVAQALDSEPWPEHGLEGVALMGTRLRGPISLAVELLDSNDQPLLHTPEMLDALAKFLRLRAAWLEHSIGSLAPQTLICLDEPLLDVLDSPFAPLPWPEALALIEEALADLSGHRGLAPGAGAPWELMLRSSADLLVCPIGAAAKLLQQGPALAEWLQRGGVIAWALLPADEQPSVGHTVGRFAALCQTAEAQGIGTELLTGRSLLAIDGRLDVLSSTRADALLAALAELSALVRERYGLGGELPRHPKPSPS